MIANYELGLAQNLSADLKNKIPQLRTKIRKSNQSRSTYLYATHKNKAVGIRISDHERILPPQRVKFETRRPLVDVFYLSTQSTIGGRNNYDVSSIDALTNAVVEYFTNVSRFKSQE